MLPHDHDVSIFKAQGGPRGNLESHYWEKTPQNETINCSGKQSIFFSNWGSTSDPPFSQLSTIASQSTLGAELLSQAYDSAPTEPSSADSQKEPILVEITDASKMTGDVSPSIAPPDVAKVFSLNSWFLFSFHPSSDLLSHQILSEETPMQKQESGSPPIDNDHVDVENDPVVDTHTADSLVITQLMVRKSYIPFIFLQWLWTKKFPWYL